MKSGGRPRHTHGSTHRPRRSLGQNFLVDRSLQARIVDAVDVRPRGVVLEIGPGRGAITEGLLRRVTDVGATLVLVELDDHLVADLAAEHADRSDVRIVHGDILDHPLTSLASDPSELDVVGNIPYNLTSPILFHVLAAPRPREIVVMLQAEVADRILADPGGRTYGALTVGVRSVASVERILRVPAGAFRPRPKVDSAVVRIRPFRPSPLAEGEEARLRRLVRAVFQWRRKQLAKILREHPDLGLAPEAVEAALRAARADARDRPEDVSPEGFVAMARRLSL